MKYSICDVNAKELKVSMSDEYVVLTIKPAKKDSFILTLPTTKNNVEFARKVKKIVSNHYKIVVDDSIKDFMSYVERYVFVYDNEFYVINRNNEIQLLKKMVFDVNLESEVIQINGNGLDFRLENLALSESEGHKIELDRCGIAFEKGIYWSQSERKFYVALYDVRKKKSIIKKCEDFESARKFKLDTLAKLLK